MHWVWENTYKINDKNINLGPKRCCITEIYNGDVLLLLPFYGVMKFEDKCKGALLGLEC
jgi:hypothetical protein